MDRFERIKKECFWDYDITPQDIERIYYAGSKREKKKLFDKIIYNSKDKVGDLNLFSTDDLDEFFAAMNPTYNTAYISRHISVLRFLLLNKEVSVKGLEWKKR